MFTNQSHPKRNPLHFCFFSTFTKVIGLGKIWANSAWCSIASYKQTSRGWLVNKFIIIYTLNFQENDMSCYECKYIRFTSVKKNSINFNFRRWMFSCILIYLVYKWLLHSSPPKCVHDCKCQNDYAREK